MEAIKKKIHCLSWFYYYFAVDATLVFAADDDPFETATDKTNLLVEYLSGDFAIALCTLVIVIAGVLLMFNKLSMKWAISIGGGATIILVAGQAAQFLFGD